MAQTVCSSRWAVRAGLLEVRWTEEVHAGQQERDILATCIQSICIMLKWICARLFVLFLSIHNRVSYYVVDVV